MDKDQAIEILEKNRAVLKDLYGVDKIGMFGSIVRGELSSSSDIDIVVEIKKEKKKLHNFLSLKKYLENKLGKPVDLGIESTIKPIVREAIADEIVYV